MSAHRPVPTFRSRCMPESLRFRPEARLGSQISRGRKGVPRNGGRKQQLICSCFTPNCSNVQTLIVDRCSNPLPWDPLNLPQNVFRAILRPLSPAAQAPRGLSRRRRVLHGLVAPGRAAIPYYTIPYRTILYYTLLYSTLLYYTILYYTIPCALSRDDISVHVSPLVAAPRCQHHSISYMFISCS